MSEPLLEVRDLHVGFAGAQGTTAAVSGLGFSLSRGETLGIVGESGSGKTVSCMALMRLLRCPPAQVAASVARFSGTDLLRCPARRMRALRGDRVGMVFQDPSASLNPYLRIGWQLCEPLWLHAGMSRRAARRAAVEMLERTGIADASSRMRDYPHEFSGGQRQRIMLAMALVNDPDLLIADEPTTALDVTVQAQILDLIADLQRRSGMAIIFISHDLSVVAQVADRALVMDAGRVVESGPVERLFSAPSHPRTRELIEAVPRGARPARAPAAGAPDAVAARGRPGASAPRAAPLLEVRGLIVRYGHRRRAATAVDGVDLAVRAGEILGLVGESGCGKTSVARAVMRLLAPAGGTVCLNGVEVTAERGRALRAARRGAQMIFQHPAASLNPRMRVGDILAEPLRHYRLAGAAQVPERIAAALEQVGLGAGEREKYPHELSGGQCQRVAIARALLPRPELLIADEPVSALDMTVQAGILRLLLRLSASQRFGMLLISHDLAVVRSVTDRCAVMFAGQIVETAETEALFSAPTHPYTCRLIAAAPAWPGTASPQRERG